MIAYINLQVMPLDIRVFSKEMLKGLVVFIAGLVLHFWLLLVILNDIDKENAKIMESVHHQMCDVQ